MLPAWIHTSDFVDTRLSFLFADENVLAKPGETTPNSPGPRIAGTGQTAQFNQFYDNFNTRYTGFETLSNLVLYKKSDTFFHGLSAEAALALTVLVLAEKNNPQTQSTAIQDASSYIRLNYAPAAWDAKTEGISFTGFPLSADRMRLGYAYKISWGGSDIFPNQGGSVPGAKLMLNKNLGSMPFYAYAGIKTTTIENAQIHELETNYGVLGGAGIDVLPILRLEANAGYFQKGVNPEPQVLGVPVNSRGVAAEAVFHKGEPIGYSPDFALYKNDPNQPINFFRPESYPGGLSYTVALEGDFLQQTLADPDIFGATKTQNASASALQIRVKYDYLRLGFLGLYRSLSYIQFNAPGFPPFYDFPANTTEDPELFFAVNADYYFPAIHLTLGGIGGLQRPSSFTTSDTLGGNNPPAGLSGTRTVVVTDINTFDVLPTGASAVNVFSAKGTARMDISEYIAAVGQIYYTRNNNLTTFKDDILGVSEPSFQKPDILGFNLLLQARF
ncbi:MAG: hypothetical protein JST54_34815 [Deltaproteobacteria bacterium]|nr:hypothetical protein [Deltaproteobacteria bacterium]